MMFAKQLYDTYENYKEKSLFHRRLKHNDIFSLIEKRNSEVFEISEIGKSFDGREIFMLKAGKGDKKVMLWSQMHGNEPTATQTLFDIFNFFENPAFLKDEAKQILSSRTLYFIPLLNPDGAEKFQRRNAQEIDINRDALRLESPEAKLLMTLRDEINPEFGFNLHDQDIWYSAGDTKFPATLSFLTPASDKEKSINVSRKKSIQLIADMNTILQNFIPNQIGRYSDDFMPTAFGDNIQKRGTSTILIESGGFADDPEKQIVRKLNFIAILYALKSIGNNNFENKTIDDYKKIPFNKKNKLFDYIIRNAQIQKNNLKYKADIGIRSKSLPDKDIFEIDDIGDLSQNFAYSEIDMNGNEIIPVNIGDDAEFLIQTYFVT